MQLELSKKEFRRLLDMVYIGNWILNSTRGEDRFQDYDHVESLLFDKARQEGMGILAETYRGQTIPSRAFVEGGIHEAIMEYENNVFFDILAEDLARRDMNDAPIDESNYAELAHRIEAYITEPHRSGPPPGRGNRRGGFPAARSRGGRNGLRSRQRFLAAGLYQAFLFPGRAEGFSAEGFRRPASVYCGTVSGKDAQPF